MSNLNTKTPVRVRFAPSPTGFLHIGGVRVALFNWLYAKQHQGQFLLRIEDTDLDRSETQYTQDILASMKWLGLTWDEDPIFQSKRLAEYSNKAEELRAMGHAYRCYCTEEEVEKMREKAIKEGKKPQYDRRCRDRKDAPTDKPFVIRAKIPLEGHVEFHDLIRGQIRVQNEEIDDFVLIRSNGAPTYNLSVVVDDVYSRITHVMRGDDHINNTPKQMHLYQVFKYPVPQFAHLPMILGADKKKLSKRHGAVSANAYRAEGYLPEALLNFLVRLGWSHGDQEIFSIAEMTQFFSFDHVQKSAAVFNLEKLLWLNGAHIRQAESERLQRIVVEDYSNHFGVESLKRAKTSIGIKLVALIQPKVKLLVEMAQQLVPLCTPGAVEVDTSGMKWDKDANLKITVKAAVKHAVDMLQKKLGDTKAVTRTGNDGVWGTSPALGDVGMTAADVDALLRQVCEQHGIKLSDIAQPMRLTVTGRQISAGLFDLMAVLPWDVVEARLCKVETL
jgi:glutamyl-tRNA synthetase